MPTLGVRPTRNNRSAGDLRCRINPYANVGKGNAFRVARTEQRCKIHLAPAQLDRAPLQIL